MTSVTGRRRRVLVLAESAHPEAQSVSWIGWAHSRALAEHHDVHLVTRSANREAIKSAGLVEGRDFTAIDLDDLEQPILRLASRLRGHADKGWTLLMALSLPIYYAFERRAQRKFAQSLQERRFEVVHRITPVSPTMPSLMAGSCVANGVPFVLGPLNGGLPWPRQFAELRRVEREWLSYVRDAYRLVPGYRSTRRRARAILAGSLETLHQLPRGVRHKTIYLPENGIDPLRFPAPVRARPGIPPRALFVGRLVPYKGCDMALQALAEHLRNGLVRFDVVGDGPERPRLEKLGRDLGIADRVSFHGRVSPAEVPRYYAQSDLLVFPSIREFGGGVVLEAMAMGLVPVVVDYGGPGELVTAATGIKVGLGERDDIVPAMADAITRLIAEPETVERMAAAGRQRIETLFSWRRKAQQVTAVYDWVLADLPERPCFGFLDKELGLS